MAEKICKITLQPSGLQKEFPAGVLLWEALLDMGIMVKTPCGGKGTCGKCLVEIRNNDCGEVYGVLACNFVLDEDIDVLIEIIDQTKVQKGIVRDFVKGTESNCFAFAVDVGTTTVKMSLVDTTSGRTYDLPPFLNPQRRFGHDVISRISAASEPSIMRRMTDLIREEVTLTAVYTCYSAGIGHDKVSSFLLSGNTSMLTIFFGIDPTPIGRSPYKAPVLDFNEIDAGFFRHEFPNALIKTIPAKAAFLGGDLVGGLSLCRNTGYEKNTFFIDLGTNGELFVSNGNGNVTAASCALGPAIEGMNMSSGMTADDGAVNHCWAVNGKLVYDMIGDGKPAGLTGTAIIELISILIDNCTITSTGTLMQTMLPTPAVFNESDGQKTISLWEDIKITQKDIRNLQLAKAASLSASRLLLKKSGISEDEILNVIIAGAIGEHLDIDSFKRLGFIPDFKSAEWVYMGNTSLKAAERACFDIGFIEKTRLSRDKIMEVELASEPSFQEEFLKAINFPERIPDGNCNN